VRQIAAQSGHSVRTIRRIIKYWLEHPPAQQVELAVHRHLLLDGTYIDGRKGIFAVMEAKHYAIIYGASEMAEGPSYLNPFCAQLKEQGLVPRSATVDGNLHVMRTLRSLWPGILIQRCLVHIQRHGLMWCRRYPKRTDAKHLRTLFLKVMTIHTTADRDHFISELRDWECRYGTHIARSPEKGWVFSDLKRARSMLLSALPDMFHYLDDPLIPNCTNALEGYFARLKHRYRQHRGLARHHRDAYFRWYLRLCPR
jgi:hypothetical protein